MSAPSLPAPTGAGFAPRWARIGSFSRLGTILAVLVLFCISGGMLWLVGYNYDGLAGGAATKIHPSTYMIMLVFGWSVLACGDPVSRSIHLVNQRPATILMLVVSVVVIAITILRDGQGLGGIVDTYIAACLLVLLLADADETLMARLERLLHIVMAVNAVMALGEFVTQIRFFPYRFDGVAFETDTRSTALHGHPLANAMVTACYLMSLMNGGRSMPGWARGAMIGLQSAALVVFGGRTALLICLFAGAAYGFVALLTTLKRGRVSLPTAAAACVLAAAIPAAIAGLAGLGFFNDVADRFVSDGGSANARKEMFDLLAMFSPGDLFFGPDTDLVDTLRRVNGLEWGIENPVIRMVLYQGAIVTLLVTIGFCAFMFELSRVTRGGLWLPMVIWIVLLNGSESISTKTTLMSKFAVIALCMYRPGPRLGQTMPPTRPASARAP